MNFSDLLLEHIRYTKKGISRDLSKREIFLSELVFIHNCCIASEQLLLEAKIHCSAYGDSFTKYLEKYYGDHLEEERGEIDILNDDLKVAGIDWTKTMINPNAIGMIGSQYYMLKHVHPACLLGYMAIQEMDPTPIEIIERLEKLHGKEILKFCRLHAVKDIDHAKELVQLVDAIPEGLKNLVRYSADNALEYYGGR